MQVLAHGGAGSPPDEPRWRQRRLQAAADVGVRADTPMAAVCGTVRALERDPAFNAGVGSAVQSDGHIRTDAGIMTDDRHCGAVAGLEDVAHAIDAARAVLEETPHVLLAGEPAEAFAAANGIETDADCWSHETHERWRESEPPGTAVSEQLDWHREHYAGHDTVGAVATDGDRLVAGTSTGGRWAALAGRIGDVPQVGAGFYASDAGGASATGAGEDIAREALARQAVELVADGHSPATAARDAIDAYGEHADGTAGVIVLDHDGRAGSAYDSAAMQTATARR